MSDEVLNSLTNVGTVSTGMSIPILATPGVPLGVMSTDQLQAFVAEQFSIDGIVAAEVTSPGTISAGEVDGNVVKANTLIVKGGFVANAVDSNSLILSGYTASAANGAGTAQVLPARPATYVFIRVGPTLLCIPAYPAIALPFAGFDNGTTRSAGMVRTASSAIPGYPAVVNLSLRRGYLADAAFPDPFNGGNDVIEIPGASEHIIFYGASITDGYGANYFGFAQQYIAYAAQNKGVVSDYCIKGYDGYGHSYVNPQQPQLTDNLLNVFGSQVTPNVVAGVSNYLHLFDGASNDLVEGGGISPSAAWTQTVAVINAAKALSTWSGNPARILVGTVVSRNDNGAGGAIQTNIDAYNALVRANIGATGATLVDYAANTPLTLANTTNPVYYASDMVHPTRYGASFVANELLGVLHP